VYWPVIFYTEGHQVGRKRNLAEGNDVSEAVHAIRLASLTSVKSPLSPFVLLAFCENPLFSELYQVVINFLIVR
jgi:hypothetical protein